MNLGCLQHRKRRPHGDGVSGRLNKRLGPEVARRLKAKADPVEEHEGGRAFHLKVLRGLPVDIASGGMKGELSIWDLEESGAIVSHFQGKEAYDKLKQQEKDAGLEGRLSPEPQNDDSESDSEEGMADGNIEESDNEEDEIT
eukprot:CAMPEP_0168349586 /NCGR_PEP_ID=MMETSP0213-20121227/20524_1 /TAXON_ID=151035 /ORGANISM="Euplotes harpa, Strain FSP1.4" /LENGTH=141 /DNA_ID=CAMNT_0008359595 /DNA_START=486 /DNA_END=909 /DNA_ORIENTATION=+